MRQGTSAFLAHRLRELACGCGFSALLAPALVHSLALEEISVHSHLGQPLEAVIPVSIASGEALADTCFSVSGAAGAGLPAIEGVRVRLDRATGQLVLRSPRSVREPLNELTIRVRCAGVPALDRSFLVVLDPPDARAENVFARTTDASTGTAADAATAGAAASGHTRAAGAAPAVEARPVESVADPETSSSSARGLLGLPTPHRAPAPAPVAPAVAIEPGSGYLVQIGDTLSSVAARVRGRPSGSLWTIAARIQAGNPLAFVGGNPDRLIAGVEIVIPPLDGAQSSSEAVAARVPSVSPEPAAPPVREAPATPEPRPFALSTALSNDSTQALQRRPLDARQAAVNSAADPVPAPRAEAPAVAEGAAASLRERAPAESRSPSSWMHWLASALGAALAGVLLGAVVMRIVLYRRQAAELHRRQSMRRASGLERSIRLDHGIIVKEHPAGTPLTVDASTQEIAAIRPLAARLAMPVPARETRHELAARDGVLLDFSTDAADEITLKIASPITELDLELPEIDELPTVPDADEVPAEVVAAATRRDPLADSRQFAVDTDLMELAYREPTADADDLAATVKLEAPHEPARDDAPAHPTAVAGGEAYYHLEADTLDDTLLLCERADESKVVALWDRNDGKETVQASAARPRASAKG